MLTLLPGEWAQGLKPGGVLCLKECCYPGAAFWVDLKDNSIMRWEVVEGVWLTQHMLTTVRAELLLLHETGAWSM